MSFEEGRRWIAALADRDLAARDQLWWLVLQADIGLGAGDPRRMVEVTDAAIDLGSAAGDPAGVVIAMVYRGMVQLVRPSDAVERLDRASERARQLHEPALDRLARAVRVVALLQLGRRSRLSCVPSQRVTTRLTMTTTSRCGRRGWLPWPTWTVHDYAGFRTPSSTACGPAAYWTTG